MPSEGSVTLSIKLGVCDETSTASQTATHLEAIADDVFNLKTVSSAGWTSPSQSTMDDEKIESGNVKRKGITLHVLRHFYVSWSRGRNTL